MPRGRRNKKGMKIGTFERKYGLPPGTMRSKEVKGRGMTKQEEIREGIHNLIGDCLISVGCGEGSCFKAEIKSLEAQEKCLEGILAYLHSQGVVIKVERELPNTIPVLPKFLKRGIITDDDLLEYARVTEVLNRIEYIKAGYVAVENLIKEE